MLLPALVLYNLVCTATLLLLVYQHPRFMMQDYPPEILAGIPPKTDLEKRASLIYGLPFLLAILVYPLIFGFINKFTLEADFLKNWRDIFLLMGSFNLFDLLVLDWLVFCTLTPPMFILPGTEGHPGYKNYRFHLIAFLKGMLFVAAGSVLFAGFIEGIALIL